MNILICGASGFVGRHLRCALEESGHAVIGAVRRPRRADDIAVDFCTDVSKEQWLPRLGQVDVVINAVGVLRDSHANPMRRLHHDTPLALFAACAEAGVERIVHISALGVDSGVDATYFTSRRAAEDALRGLPESVRWLCLRPSVIYGEDGESAKMFRRLASMPIHLLPMGGTQTMQPVHIDDLCTAVVQWLDRPDAENRVVAAVGAEATTMRGMLDSYRTQLGFGDAWHVSMPEALVRIAARAGDFVPSSPLCSDTCMMMEAGNTADAAAFTRLIGHAPKSYREFIA